MVILNDRLVAEELMNKGFILKKKVFVQLHSLIRHLVFNGYNKEDTLNVCRGVLLGLEDVRLFGGEDNIEVSLKNAYSNALKIPYTDDLTIEISKEEIEAIKKVPLIRQQKIVFTILAIERFQSLNYKVKPKDFICVNIGDILKLAGCDNIYSSSRYSLLNGLTSGGYLEVFNGKKDICYRAAMRKPPISEEEVGAEVNNWENLGEQWIKISGQDSYTCKMCGGVFPKLKSGHDNEYCPECFKIHRREYIANKVREFRAKSKQESKKNIE